MRKLSRAYLGAPYTTADAELRAYRIQETAAWAAGLALRGYSVFAPTVQGHTLAQHLPGNYLHHHEFWMGQCLPQLHAADVFIVLPLPGWRKSRGLQEELTYYISFAKVGPVFLQEPIDAPRPLLERLDGGELEQLEADTLTIERSQLCSANFL